jgi:hypothetical protein
VAQINPQALDSLFVAPYDSQSYDRGIRIRLHTGVKFFSMGVQILVVAPDGLVNTFGEMLQTHE